MIADLIEHINETTKWKMSLYIPYRSIKGSNIAKMFTNPLIEVHFYNDIPYEGKYVIPALRDYLYRKGLANIDIWNVIQAGIMLLILLGYKTIHLYGVENSEPNSLKVNEKNQAGYIHELFYDKSQSNMELILNEDGSPKTSPLFVNSHSYLLWLLKNNKAGFLQLLSIYLQELLQNEEFKSKLDKLI